MAVNSQLFSVGSLVLSAIGGVYSYYGSNQFGRIAGFTLAANAIGTCLLTGLSPKEKTYLEVNNSLEWGWGPTTISAWEVTVPYSLAVALGCGLLVAVGARVGNLEKTLQIQHLSKPLVIGAALSAIFGVVAFQRGNDEKVNQQRKILGHVLSDKVRSMLSVHHGANIALSLIGAAAMVSYRAGLWNRVK